MRVQAFIEMAAGFAEGLAGGFAFKSIVADDTRLQQAAVEWRRRVKVRPNAAGFAGTRLHLQIQQKMQNRQIFPQKTQGETAVPNRQTAGRYRNRKFSEAQFFVRKMAGEIFIARLKKENRDADIVGSACF